MDAEYEEAPTKPSPPLLQNSETASHAPLDLSTTPSQCHTDLIGFPNSGGGDILLALSSGSGPGEDHEAVIAGELSEAEAVDAGTRKENKGEVGKDEGMVVGKVAGTTEAVVVTEIGDLGDEGREMQVTDIKEDKGPAAATEESSETVEEKMGS